MHLLKPVFNTRRSLHIARLHKSLAVLDDQMLKGSEDKKKKAFGPATSWAVKEVKKSLNLPANDRLDKRSIAKINQAVIDKTLESKTQVRKIHKKILRAIRIAKIDTDLSKDIKSVVIGSETKSAVKRLKTRYKLKKTSVIDPAFIEKVESINASRPKPIRKLKTKPTQLLNKVRHPLRLNKISSRVNDLQNALSWLDYTIDKKEYHEKRYGKTTRKAVIEFQKKQGLPVSGNIGWKTKTRINQLIESNRRMVPCKEKYRVRGTVRDDVWKAVPYAKIQVYERQFKKDNLLVERKSLSNGFYDVQYLPPKDPVTGKAKQKFQLQIKWVDRDNQLIAEKSLHVFSKVLWANFTLGNQPYKGASIFDLIENGMTKKINDNPIYELEASERSKDVSYLRRETDLASEDIMKMMLSHRCARMADDPVLDAQVFYAFIHQNMPDTLPGNLYPDKPQEWDSWIGETIPAVLKGVAFCDQSIAKDILESALKQNYIPRQYQPRLDDILDALNEFTITYVLEKPVLPGNISLKALLDPDRISQKKYRRIAAHLNKNKRFDQGFWTDLEDDPAITDLDFNRIKKMANLGHIANNHIETVTFLREQLNRRNRDGLRLKSISGFALLTHEDWKKIISDNANSIPDWVKGESLFKRQETYARILELNTGQLYSSIWVVAGINRSSQHKLGDISGILKAVSKVPDYRIETQPVQELLDQPGVSLSESDIYSLKAIQRVFRIGQSAGTSTALVESGYYSSAQVYQSGLAKLVSALTDKGVQEKEAEKVFKMAECQYATSMAMMIKYRDQLQVHPGCIPSYKLSQDEMDDLAEQIPEIETLFGPLESREVRHCDSVLGPSAYLVDVLRFLDQKESIISDTSAKDILFQRRPDLGNIKLNCQNTKTPLPYIDLVCEILESHVSGGSGNIDFQSTLTAKELRAEPEHLEPQAYHTIKGSDFPLYGSFNLWQEETRIFLKQLGIDRYEMMDTFQADPLSIAAEYLGISSQEIPIITTPRPSLIWQRKYWGNDLPGGDAQVSYFLIKSDLTYIELLCLLNTDFANHTTPKTVISTPVDIVDPDHQTLIHVSNPNLDRMNRFLRLWKKTDFTMWELDLLIMHSDFGESKIDAAFLINLKQFLSLGQILNLDAEQLHGFYSDINTILRYKTDDFSTPEKNLFENIFLRGAIDEDLKADFSVLLSAKTTGLDLEDYKDHIMACLSMDTDSFDLLASKTSDKLTRSSLSFLYRYVTIAGILNLDMKDFLNFLTLVDIADPFASMETTKEVIRLRELVKQSKTGLLKLDYILNPAMDSSRGLRLEVYTQKITMLREAIAGLQSKITEAEDADEDSLEMLLNMLAPFEDTQVMGIVFLILAGTWSATQTEITEFIEMYFSPFVSDIEDAVNTLKYTAAVSESELAERRSYLKTELVNYISMTTVKELTAVSFSIHPGQADLLLTGLTLDSGTQRLITILQSPKLFEKGSDDEYVYDIDTVNLNDVFRAMKLLHKASVLISSLKMSTEELEWFMGNHALVHTIDLNQLPIETGQASLNFTDWEYLYRLLTIKKMYPAPEDIGFFDVLDAAGLLGTSLETMNQKICLLTGWNVDEHEDLVVSPMNFTHPDTWEWLTACYGYRNITGAAFGLLRDLVLTDEEGREYEKACSVKDMVKSRYKDDQWIKVFEPIMDTLREKKRTALVSYLMENSQRTKSATITNGTTTLANPEYWNHSNDLFRWFCIDVEMCSDQLTSRIKQAISTCQLFVNQCFLNIEPDVTVTLPDPDIENSWKQWKWMKNYRIWEANRKVFLYPENWIEPELRHDKSPFFKEFEDDLLSQDMTDEHAEAALQRYIQKLDQVADLKIASTYHQKEDDVNLLHVIAHTHDNPPAYFYRTFDLIYNKWSAWERIETEIDSAHAVPFIYNRKLHLFWITFLEKPIKIQKLPPFNQSTENEDAPVPPLMFEIQLAWTILTKDGWQAATVSKKKLIHPWQRPGFSYNIKPRYKSYDNTLMIELYITTSREFNSEKFYNQFKNKKKKFTSVPYDETFKPWHSSSFVFDGKVREILLYSIPGYYFSPENNDIKMTNSYDFVKNNFGEDARNIKKLDVNSYSLALPSGMHYHYTRLKNNTHDDINESRFNVFSYTRDSVTLLNKAKSPFEAVLCQQGLTPVDDKIRPLFYQDESRSFFIKQDSTFIEWVISWFFGHGNKKVYSIYPFYHPWSRIFQQEINRKGVEGLYDRRLQLNPSVFSNKAALNFDSRYQPVGSINLDAVSQEDIDFSRSGPYSIYNWELFFHAPMLVASRLTQNQRFEEAMTWYHYIFDPTNTQNYDTPQRFWITKPFFNTSDNDYKTQRIQYIIEHIDDFKVKLVEWRNHPFRPHLVAEHRTVAYQKAVVMKYIENLISWGDRLFGRDTMESINEALLLYVIASDLLGERPHLIPALNLESRTYNELEAESEVDELGNFRTETNLENIAGLPVIFEMTPGTDSESIPYIDPLYFGLPHNDKLLSFWDTVADRLFKIRHSMNIKGIKRQLALFEPPIDPGLLVKAAAAGIDLATVLDHINAPSQVYRFHVVTQKAIEFCKEVSLLGEKLITALEKKDLEQISLLHSINEWSVLKDMKKIKEAKIDEAQNEIEGFEKRIEIGQARLDHMESLKKKIEEEKKAQTMGDHVTASNAGEKVCIGLAKVATWIPQFEIGPNGAGGTPKATAETGGNQVEKAFDYGRKGFEAASKGFKMLQEYFEKQAKSKRKAAVKKMEEKIVTLEKEFFEKQKTVSEIKKYMAQKELSLLEKKIELAQGEKEYLQTKYTNAQLYQWMVSQISSIYFQAYQLAYDMGKRAEKSYQKEIGGNASFIEFGYWDSLKKGLLSADKLSFDIRRMQAAYLEQNKRDLEITKHVSLANLAPDILMELKLTGSCVFDIEEWMYNLDYPGHYRRRIKTVSVTVLCDADQFTNINCSLTLLDSEIRTTGVLGVEGYEKIENDTRFTEFSGKGQAIATSYCEYDSGLFNLKFDDDRFLPFEGEGAISSWDIQMPIENNQFDFNRMSDFVIHISYTASEGGETLAGPARTDLAANLSGSRTLLVGLSYSFPKVWETFLEPEVEGSEQIIEFTIKKSFYPFLDRNRDIQISRIGLAIQGRHSGNYDIALSLPAQDTTAAILPDTVYSDVHFNETVFEGSSQCTGDFSLKIKRDTSPSGDFSSLPENDLYEVYFIIDYH